VDKNLNIKDNTGCNHYDNTVKGKEKIKKCDNVP